jgi:hypothetical protein
MLLLVMTIYTVTCSYAEMQETILIFSIGLDGLDGQVPTMILI